MGTDPQLLKLLVRTLWEASPWVAPQGIQNSLVLFGAPVCLVWKADKVRCSAACHHGIWGCCSPPLNPVYSMPSRGGSGCKWAAGKGKAAEPYIPVLCAADLTHRTGPSKSPQWIHPLYTRL